MGGGPTPLGPDHLSCLRPKAKQPFVLEWGPALPVAWHRGHPCHSPLMNGDFWRSISRGGGSRWCFDGTGHTCPHSTAHRAERGGTAARSIGCDQRQAGHNPVMRDWRASIGLRRTSALTALNAVGDGWGVVYWWPGSPPHSLPPPRGG